MLLYSYKIALILPCLADPEKIRVAAKISDEIRRVLPPLDLMEDKIDNSRSGWINGNE